MVLDPPSVRACDISVDALFADTRKAFLMRFDSSCDVLRRLIVIQMFLYKRFQIGMLHDLHCLVLALVSRDIRFVLSFFRVVGVLDLVICYLVPDSRGITIECFSDIRI